MPSITVTYQIAELPVTTQLQVVPKAQTRRRPGPVAPGDKVMSIAVEEVARADLEAMLDDLKARTLQYWDDQRATVTPRA